MSTVDVGAIRIGSQITHITHTIKKTAPVLFVFSRLVGFTHEMIRTVFSLIKIPDKEKPVTTSN